MANQTSHVADLNAFAESLERKTLDLIQAGNWDELSEMIAPECQFATNGGVFDKDHALDLMRSMKLAEAILRNVKATVLGDNLIVSFELACSELMSGTPQSKDFSPRLSVWKEIDGAHRCIAYGDFNKQ